MSNILKGHLLCLKKHFRTHFFVCLELTYSINLLLFVSVTTKGDDTFIARWSHQGRKYSWQSG